MDEDSNPLIHLPKIIRFQLMLYLSIMWCFIFSVWTGWMVLFGPSIFIHVVILIGIYLKDANEYLKIGKSEDFMTLWWAAKPFTPAGIINLHDLGDSLYEENYCDTCLYPWSGLNEKTYGMRTGELVTFTSGAGMGKSSIMRELMHHLMI